MPRTTTFLTAALAAMALASPAVALAQSAPSLTDPAGDAVDRYGRTVDAADLREGSLRIEGDQLVARTRVTGLASFVSASTTLRIPVENARPLDIGQVIELTVTAGDVNAGGFVRDADPLDGTGGVPVTGTATTDTATGVLTARYALEDINRALDAREAQRIGAGTSVSYLDATATARQRGILPRAANDQASALGPFTL
ncbi:hypothetical protein GKE82_16225 [Conexibacter sp. W3-3-2]|uniref:hypothetical protein n=1 Tax=Conexibacter sp. W3-3-2 TaxID=2675227 RepID=UPI0012B7425C|nr:hypothetical protein [Conexibacter sp. W3-3-2]MTD45794.1 hypothetical protein [Conexibacter sp. W3-3-2]